MLNIFLKLYKFFLFSKVSVRLKYKNLRTSIKDCFCIYKCERLDTNKNMT